MKNRRKNKKINLLLLVILGPTLGFALLSTTLKINGTAGIKSNTWSIHWVKNSITETDGSVTATTKADTTDSANQVIEFTAEFELPGDYYEFTVDAINEGSIDGTIADDTDIKKGVYNLSDQLLTTTPENFKYTVVYADDDDDPENDVAPAVGDILKANGGTKKYKVRVEFDSEAEGLPETAESYKFKFEVVYTQYKETAPSANYEYKTRQVAGAISQGDEICAGSECFTVVSSNSDTTVLFAKYNIAIPEEGYATMPGSEMGMQYDLCSHPEIIGGFGEVPFIYNQSDGYWKGKVGTDDSATYKGSYTDVNNLPYVYDPTYNSKPNAYENYCLLDNYTEEDETNFCNEYPKNCHNYCTFDKVDDNYVGLKGFPIFRDSGNENYSIAYYVEKYKTLLKSKGYSIDNVRLLSYSEAESLSKNVLKQGCNDYGYWLGNAVDDTNVYYVSYGGSISADYDGHGIRPVIEVSTSKLK